MLGVGVTLSTLPLYLQSLGATPNQLGITIAMFSGAQMIGCPLLVGLSNRKGVGRLSVLRACLTGNACAALLTSIAGGWRGVTCARILAGLFAASVPVAQVAVADLAPPGPETSKALSRVASAASLGIVVGPAMGGLIAEIARRVFLVPANLESRVVFGCSGVFAAIVLLLTAGVRLDPYDRQASEQHGSKSEDGASIPPSADASAAAPAFAQPLLRWIALVCSLSITTGIAIYALFSQAFLGYGQPELSLSQSSAAAVALCCQLLLLPRLLDTIGEALSCVTGLTLLGLTFGASSLVRAQPLHFLLFVGSRGGHALAEVSTAALTASASSPERRGRNLALLQSFQAGSRLVSPLLASRLYTLSLGGTMLGPSGALPFLVVGALALLTAPTPLLLRRL